MRKSTAVLLVAAALSVLSGCDFLRSVAGRPTSKEIEAKKAALLSALEAESSRDSVDVDSLEAMKTIEEEHIKIASPSHSGALVPENNGGNYFVMIGTFSRKSNAEALAQTCRNAGYSPVLIPYSNGYTAVAANSYGTVQEALFALEELKKCKFCPADAWILSAR